MDNWKEIQEGRLLNLKDVRQIELSKHQSAIEFVFNNDILILASYPSYEDAHKMYDSIKTILVHRGLYPSKY